MTTSDTAHAILDAAQALAQTRGFNAFSYRDLADRVGIRTASIHYHFPSKADLGRALVERYHDVVAGMLAAIARDTTDAPERLARYADLLESVLATPGEGDELRICLGGMLASDFPTLPPDMQEGVAYFVRANVAWLADVLERGRNDGTLAFTGDSDAAATALFSALEGAMMVARSCDDPSRYRATADWLLANFARNASTAVGTTVG